MTEAEKTPPIKIEIEEMNQSVRKEFIDVAVKFLNNPKVAQTSISQRKHFLKTKGLTEYEIEEAFRQSSLQVQDYAVPAVPPQKFLSGPQYVLAQPSLFLKIRDGLQSVALFSALMYGIYLFYKRYIAPFFFGTPKKKSIDNRLDQLDNEMKIAINELKETIALVHADISTININQRDTKLSERQLEDLKIEIGTVKGLLLSRKQFPAAVANSPVVPPSIPAWQLSSVGAAAEMDEPVERDKPEEMLETESGSGSSETEVVTKNSDSSIEIV